MDSVEVWTRRLVHGREAGGDPWLGAFELFAMFGGFVKRNGSGDLQTLPHPAVPRLDCACGMERRKLAFWYRRPDSESQG
jgi:hypothetical protein